MKLPNNVLSSLRTKKKVRQRFERNALRGAAKPMRPEDLEALKPIDMKKLKEHIGGIFPLVINLASEGEDLQDIERLLGINARVLQNITYQYPKLGDAIKAARSIRLDDQRIREMPNAIRQNEA